MKIYKTIIGIIALVCSMNVSAQTETADTLRGVKDTIAAAPDTLKMWQIQLSPLLIPVSL